MDTKEEFVTYADIIKKQLKQGVELENKRFRVAQQFPVSPEMAQIHYKANWFGFRSSDEDRVCPCCLERIKEKQFSFWGTSMSNNFLSTDIILFFCFIRFLAIFLALKILITDGYSLWTNYHSYNCGSLLRANCKPTLIPRLSTINRDSDSQTLFISDLLNLIFLIVSIIFWTILERYSYKNLFIDVAAQIQSQDDYSIFVEDIPVVQDTNQGIIDYRKSLKQYFNNIVIDWLKNPTDDELYQSYLKAAKQHGHNPNNPPRIVSKINLCWNLYELTALHELKEQIQQMYEIKTKEQVKSHPQKQSYKFVSSQTCDQLTTLDTTQIELCQQFQINEKFGFALSRFLGKAFISFQYQHFAIQVIRNNLKANKFIKDVSLKVSTASFPRDVYWQNLNMTNQQRRTRIKTTYIITIGCLVFAFLAFLGIKYYQITHQRQLSHTKWLKWIVRMSTSVISVSITMVLYWVINQLSLFEEHQTKTKYEVSYIYKSISAAIFNNIFNICFVHYLLKIQVWSTQGLTIQIFHTLIIWYITMCLYHGSYFLWVLRWIKLKWNYRTQPILKFQNRYNQQYVLPTYPLSSRYTSYLGDLYFLCFFGSLTPISSVIGLIMFFTYYFIDKINILKRSSFHPNYSYFLADKVIHLAQTSTLFFTIGNYIFSYILTGNKYNPINLLSIIISLFYLLIVWGDKLYVRCFSQYTVYQQQSYTDCINNHKFFDTYNSCNPATKLTSKQRRNKVYLGVTAPIHNSSYKPTAAPEVDDDVWIIGDFQTAKPTKA